MYGKQLQVDTPHTEYLKSGDWVKDFRASQIRCGMTVYKKIITCAILVFAFCKTEIVRFIKVRMWGISQDRLNKQVARWVDRLIETLKDNSIHVKTENNVLPVKFVQTEKKRRKKKKNAVPEKLVIQNNLCSLTQYITIHTNDASYQASLHCEETAINSCCYFCYWQG